MRTETFTETGSTVETWDAETGFYTRMVDQDVQERRPLTDQERAALVEQAEAETEATNAGALRERAGTALATNRTFLSSTPTSAQNAAQVKALTRQINALIRLTLNDFEGTD